MASLTLLGKLAGDVEIKVSPEQIHGMLAYKPQQITQIFNDRIQECELVGGEWGKVGSIFKWRYIHDGKVKAGRDLIEAINPDKNLLTLRVIDGDFLDEYKNMATTFQASPKSEGVGTVVHISVEYEKLRDEVTGPENKLQFLMNLFKDIDARLTQASKRIN